MNEFLFVKNNWFSEHTKTFEELCSVFTFGVENVETSVTSDDVCFVSALHSVRNRVKCFYFSCFTAVVTLLNSPLCFYLEPLCLHISFIFVGAMRDFWSLCKKKQKKKQELWFHETCNEVKGAVNEEVNT